MILVHLSDFHCGKNDFIPRALETAAKEISDLKPDVIVITGDITDNGFIDEYELAASYLEKFECDNVIIGSGNHDYKHTGFLLWEHFFPRTEMVTVGDVFIAHLRTARPDRDTGEVGYRQLIWFSEVLRKNEDKFKIVLQHHHLTPIPDTGMEQNIIVDAGDALRTLIEGGAHLVLCGHKHRPWRTSVEGLSVVNAGSVSSRKLRGFFSNSYNIIETEGDSFKVELKIVGGERIDFERIKSGYTAIPSRNAGRERFV